MYSQYSALTCRHHFNYEYNPRLGYAVALMHDAWPLHQQTASSGPVTHNRLGTVPDVNKKKTLLI